MDQMDVLLIHIGVGAKDGHLIVEWQLLEVRAEVGGICVQGRELVVKGLQKMRSRVSCRDQRWVDTAGGTLIPGKVVSIQ